MDVISSKPDYRALQRKFRTMAAATHQASDWPTAKPISAKAAHRIQVHYAKVAAPGPKFAKPRKHKAKAAIKATWPRTPDQKGQSRPVIVLHPRRAVIRHFGKDDGPLMFELVKHLPKHKLDAYVSNLGR